MNDDRDRAREARLRGRKPSPASADDDRASWRGGSGALTPLPVVGRAGVTRHCWEIIQADDNELHGHCQECYAHFVQRDCWTLWALREAGQKPCCQKREDCATCPVLLNQMGPRPTETVRVRAMTPIKPPPPRPGSAKQICQYLQAADVTVDLTSPHYAGAVARAAQTRSSSFRCRLRGVHLDIGYVNDMCVSRHVQECVFLEEMHPEVTVQGADDTGIDAVQGTKNLNYDLKAPYAEHDEDAVEHSISRELP